MKKFLVVFLLVVLVLCISACGDSADSAPTADAPTEEVGEPAADSGEDAEASAMSDAEAAALIAEALSQTPPEAGVALVYTTEESETPSSVSFTFDDEQLYARFSYYIAKFGQNEYPAESAEIISALNELEEGYSFEYDGYDLIVKLRQLNKHCVSFDTFWFDDTYKPFVDCVVAPAVLAAIGEIETDAVADMESDFSVGSTPIFPDGLFSMNVDSYNDMGYTFSFEACEPDAFLNAGYSMEELNYLIQYSFVEANITAGAYFSESDTAAIQEGSLSSENVTGVIIDGDGIIVQLATDEGMILASGIYRFSSDDGVYETSILYSDMDIIFEAGLQFTFENDTIQFTNAEEVYEGTAELPAEITGALPLAMAF